MTFYKTSLLILLLTIYGQCSSQENQGEFVESDIEIRDKYPTVNVDTLGPVDKRNKRVERIVKMGLDSLINKLDDNWEFVETGKAYWIGYTDEMYAIATFNDIAIPKLESFIYKSDKLKSITGAIYCIHLIGINTNIAGRFHENFVNKNARNSLLKLACIDSLFPIIIPLLGRDPWQTDLPVLYKLLQNKNSIELINSLFRYPIKNIPFREDINDVNKRIKIVLAKSKDSTIYIGDVIKVDGYTPNSLDEFFVYSDKIGVKHKFVPNDRSIKSVCNYYKCKNDSFDISEITELLGVFFKLSKMKNSFLSFCNFDQKYFHYMKSDDTLVICNLETTRQRWLSVLKKEINKNGY